MAKTTKKALKGSTKGDKTKVDITPISEAEDAVEAKIESKKIHVRANVEFYDMKAETKRRAGDEWDEEDARRVSTLRAYGFITVL